MLMLCMTTKALPTDFFKPYRPTNLRLPAVPLIVNDPYFSIWSPYDKLTDGTTRHWTDQEKPLEGFLRVDGVTYQWMGTNKGQATTAQQKSVSVLATSSYYTFLCGPMELDVVFTAPMLIDDYDLLSFHRWPTARRHTDADGLIAIDRCRCPPAHTFRGRQSTGCQLCPYRHHRTTHPGQEGRRHQHRLGLSLSARYQWGGKHQGRCCHAAAVLYPRLRTHRQCCQLYDGGLRRSTGYRIHVQAL